MIKLFRILNYGFNGLVRAWRTFDISPQQKNTRPSLLKKVRTNSQNGFQKDLNNIARDFSKYIRS